MRPVRGDQEISITSFVREFHGSDALIECTMFDEQGKTVSRCVMTCVHVDRVTQRGSDWPVDVAARFFESATG